MYQQAFSAESWPKHGFTLIELSIVLVIIGLIVGGILTGQDLINSAAIRAQIAQIEKYNTAARTFQSKYGYLPGDIPDPNASNFGFKARGGGAGGTGDGNGIIDGYYGTLVGTQETAGETVMFWVDLSTAGLIDAGLNTATATGYSFGNVTLSQYFPAAKIGNGNYVYVYEDGENNGGPWVGTGINYFGISAIATDNCSTGLISNTNPGITVLHAYNMDKKVDDGLPQYGHVQAFYLNTPLGDGPNAPGWAAGGGQAGSNAETLIPEPTSAATPYAPTNCYDNNGVAGTQTYSLAKNASTQNCALSFQFQ